MKLRKARWLQVFVLGVILFVVANITLNFTKNVIYFPTVMMIGAFLVPVTFIVFFYQQEHQFDKSHTESIWPALLVCAILGGLIGTMAAGTLESTTMSSKNPLTLLWVGPIEEFTKLIVPIVLYIVLRNRFNTELDGLLFGVAAGMSFAALETMGYELVTLVTTRGSLSALNSTIIIRGLLSPATHAAWTGLITATLWRERARTGKVFTIRSFIFFLIAAILHSLWDYSSFLSSQVIVILAYVVIGGISLFLIFRRLWEGRRDASVKAEVV